MSWKRWLVILLIGVSGGWVVPPLARAGDLRLPLPKKSRPTPVQQLNRDGVEAIKKQQYEKAKTFFYRAYLFDPNDPFTLNNLGYVSELEGQLERAKRFYALAAQQATEAVIDQSSLPGAEGRSVADAARSVPDVAMQINRANVEAIRLLSEGRAFEADTLLQRTLALDPRNTFTLNNMGVAKEMEGDDEEALKYYTAVAGSHSGEPVVVTLNSGWRGKPVAEMAAESARKVRERIEGQEAVEAKVARLNLRGVASLNRNNWQDARRYFQQAYALDRGNAFSLNNLGYLAEMEGDAESAQSFYEQARKADRANARVGFATRRWAEGRKLFEVADDSDSKVETVIAEKQEAKRRLARPIELKRRDNKPIEPQPPSAAQPESSPAQEPPSLGPPQPPIPQLTPPTQQPPAPNLTDQSNPPQ
jgi:Flp pilus assembly protein TadD